MRNKSVFKQKSEALDLFQNNRVNSLSLLFMSLQFKFSVHPCDVCIILVSPPHLFAYLVTSGYLLLTTPNNSISLRGSSYRESTVCLFFAMASFILQDVGVLA